MSKNKKTASKQAKKLVKVKPLSGGDGPTHERMRRASRGEAAAPPAQASTDLEDEVIELNGKLERLAAENAELRRQLAGATPAPSEWRRGKLPGEQLIKTNVTTGKFKTIDREEWDTLQ